MASVIKFTAGAVYNQLRHNERSIANPSNKDIDTTRSQYNYSLLPDDGLSAYDRFKARKDQLYCYNRPDVNVMASWVITAPRDLQQEDQRPFFSSCVNFLCDRYGQDNAIQAIVHADESGQPHLHFCFIPATDDSRHGGQKICANDVLNRKELRCFHPALQQYLSDAGFTCKVQTGITQEIGGNLSVQDLKRATEYVQQHKHSYGHGGGGASW